jgi:hypothetical protein
MRSAPIAAVLAACLALTGCGRGPFNSGDPYQNNDELYALAIVGAIGAALLLLKELDDHNHPRDPDPQPQADADTTHQAHQLIRELITAGKATARRGDCERVREIDTQVRQLDRSIERDPNDDRSYTTVFLQDGAIMSCLAPVAPTPSPNPSAGARGVIVDPFAETPTPQPRPALRDGGEDAARAAEILHVRCVRERIERLRAATKIPDIQSRGRALQGIPACSDPSAADAVVPPARPVPSPSTQPPPPVAPVQP